MIIQEIVERSMAATDADFLPAILGPRHRDAVKGRIPVVLFGAGSAGMFISQALSDIGVPICCFCDNHPGHVGSVRAGHPVIAAEELQRNHRRSLVVIATSPLYSLQVHEQLRGLGFPYDRIHIPPLDFLLYCTNAIKLHWTYDELNAHGEKLQQVWALLSDDKSRDLFVRRLSLLTGCVDYASYRRFIDTCADLLSPRHRDYFTAPAFDDNHFYFNSAFFPLREQEVFANVGALTGDCALEFVKAFEKQGLQYREIIAFEPDGSNFARLKEKLGHLERVRCLPFGLWSHRTRMRFSNLTPGQAGSVGCLDEAGNMEIDVISLDEALPDAEISLMIMDVEGAEMEALRGAAGIIRRHAPRMAISLYHKRDDVFEIPLFIHQLHPGYRLFLRHHSTTFSETVLYAVP